MNELNDKNIPADFDDLSKFAPTLLALRGKEGTFVVPENYFSDAASITNAIAGFPAENGFVLPENYFDDLAERIVALAGLHAKTMGENFVLPENYFSEFDRELNTKIALDNLKQDEGFSIPEDYFEKLADKIIFRAGMQYLPGEKQTDVPPGYFDTLAGRIAERIAKEEGRAAKGRVVVFNEYLRRFARPISIAASAALLIALTVWFMNREENRPKQLGEISKNENNPLVEPKLPPAPAKTEIETQEIAAQRVAVVPKNIKKEQPLNPAPIAAVHVNKEDVIAHLDQLDESTVAEFIDQFATVISDEPGLDQSIYDYLLDDNADASELIDTNTPKP
ncbi:MAG TPA: hypothetical protein VI731_10855 [Bacteroidia bacterium]|nr:hypothetical protein [Bacteroidia bacterium]